VSEDVVANQRPDRAQDIHLPIAQVAGVEADRRLHRDQAEQLQEMVLQHVLERPDAVVVAGPTFQRECLVPDDVHLSDVLAVPGGLENTVGQPGAENVLNGRHGQEVVDPVHRVLRDDLSQQQVQLGSLLQVLTEGLFQHDRAALRKPGTVQRRHRGGSDGRRECQVCRDRPATGDQGCQAARVGDVRTVVLGRGYDGVSGVRRIQALVLVQLGACPRAVFVVNPALPAHRDQSKSITGVPPLRSATSPGRRYRAVRSPVAPRSTRRSIISGLVRPGQGHSGRDHPDVAEGLGRVSGQVAGGRVDLLRQHPERG
jgi:hypothetical protein